MNPSDLPTTSNRELLSAAISAGIRRVGQVTLALEGSGFSLCHTDDSGRDGLKVFRDPFDAVRIALTDDHGAYRPLKTAPNLRHGWRLEVADLAGLHTALDFLYPAAIGNWRALLAGTLRPVPLRETLNRQTGMYRITGKLTVEQAPELVGLICRSGCTRHILWPTEPGGPADSPASSPHAIPLLCGEACCLLVAAARKIVKGIPLDQVE